jgi:hypothetical protein
MPDKTWERVVRWLLILAFMGLVAFRVVGLM